MVLILIAGRLIRLSKAGRNVAAEESATPRGDLIDIDENVRSRSTAGPL